jgi:hypothetical protein
LLVACAEDARVFSYSKDEGVCFLCLRAAHGQAGVTECEKIPDEKERERCRTVTGGHASKNFLDEVGTLIRGFLPGFLGGSGVVGAAD